MLHWRIQKQLSAYLDDELSQRRRRRVEKHLSICEDCSLLLQELREISESVASLRQTAPEDLWFAINAKLESVTSAPRSSFVRGRRWTWERIYPIMKPVAATIGIILVVATILIRVLLDKQTEIKLDYTQMDLYLTAHTQYYAQKMLTTDAVIDFPQLNADTESIQQQQINDSSEIDFYLSVYLGDNDI